jgi:hypothetical protein
MGNIPFSYWLEKWETPHMKNFKENLVRLMEDRGFNKKSLSLATGKNETLVRDLLSNTGSPRYDTVSALAKVLGVSVAQLMSEDDNVEIPPYTPPPPKPEGVPEIDVRAGMGGGGDCQLDYVMDGNGGMMATDAIKADWGLPESYLQSELRISRKSARIIEVIGDSMHPTLQSGDRVMVNTADKNPSPPGVFALWDGYGIVVKRIERVPRSDPPEIKVISDNTHHSEYSLTADEANIIGRVVWYARAL